MGSVRGEEIKKIQAYQRLALPTKSMSKMREEKTTNFQSIAIIGMLNTCTVTVPNMVMVYFQMISIIMFDGVTNKMQYKISGSNSSSSSGNGFTIDVSMHYSRS